MSDDVDPDEPRPDGHYHVDKDVDWFYVDDEPALVSSQKAGRMTGKGINDVVQRAARRAGVRPYCFSGRGDPEDVSAHTLWHSVAWRMLRVEDENTLYDVRNRLRHSSILTTEREHDHFETV